MNVFPSSWCYVPFSIFFCLFLNPIFRKVVSNEKNVKSVIQYV